MAGVPTFAVVTPPDPIVALADARAFPGVPASAPDAFVEAQIAAAIGFLDGPDGWLNRSLGQQTLQCTITPGLGFRRPEPIKILGGPALSLVSVTGLPGSDSFANGAAYLEGDALIVRSGCGPFFGGAPTPVVAQYLAGSPANVIAVVTQTILTMVAKLIAAAPASARDPSIRSESVPDVFAKTYGSAPAGSADPNSAYGSSTLAPIAYLRRW